MQQKLEDDMREEVQRAVLSLPLDRVLDVSAPELTAEEVASALSGGNGSSNNAEGISTGEQGDVGQQKCTNGGGGGGGGGGSDLGASLVPSTELIRDGPASGGHHSRPDGQHRD